MGRSRSAGGRRWPLGAFLGAALLAGGAFYGLAGMGQAPLGPDATGNSAGAMAAAKAAPLPPARVDYARLEQRIGLLMQEPDMVGFAIGTVENGRVRFVKGYGETVAGSGDPVTPETVFRWGSLSKGIASAVVMRLADEGRLSLDTPVSRMHTSLRLPGKAEDKVTVADLLSHRVGIVRNAWDDMLEAGEDPRLLRTRMATLPRFCPPSTCYSYQNIAFDTASEIVEDVTGKRYAAVARDKLFAPLGMTATSIGRAELEASPSWARPHGMAKAPRTVNDIYYGVPAAGGVNSSIVDLVTWMQAQMGAAPKVLSQADLEAMHEPRVSTPPHGRRSAMDRALTDASYGLGWRQFTYAGHHLVGHRGWVDGYGSLILFDPADKSGIVMLWNTNWHRAARLQLEFFDMLYGLPATDWLELGPPEPAAVPVQVAGGGAPTIAP